MGYETLTQEAKGLPEEKLNQVIEFVRFLKFTMRDNDSSDVSNGHRTSNPLAEDLIFIADDFDETPDVFEGYM